MNNTKLLMFLMCHNKNDKCLVLNQTILRLLCFFKISHPPVTANSCFFFSFSLFLSLPPMLASSIFFPLRLFPSPETMVKDNIYRKPPIYRQHGTVLVNTTFSGLVSARCVACRLSVISSSVYPSSPPFSPRPALV